LFEIARQGTKGIQVYDVCSPVRVDTKEEFLPRLVGWPIAGSKYSYSSISKFVIANGQMLAAVAALAVLQLTRSSK
jgi:hypothetical protein